ncbi:MAG TPA: DUF177 domain-containing protein [Desulfobacterales bacterium]|nr:DUF177 domain-containing protein [Desulfobacterales bacterium]HIP38740.1 DUF177 domain-containing protein [Desulfocapsa sulfexigens]
MKILFTDITAKNRTFDIKESFRFTDIGAELLAEVQAKLLVSQQAVDLFSITGELTANVATSCDRCGIPVQFDVDQDFYYQIRLEAEPQLASEHNCSDDDCEVLYLTDPAVEISEIISEQLLLALPGHRFCDDECKGLCDRCGINLNEKQCKCRETNENSPFAVLKQLQK